MSTDATARATPLRRLAACGAALLALALAAPLVVAGPAAAQEASKASTGKTLTVPMTGSDGKAHGTVTLTDTPHGVLLDGDLTGMADGEYAFHFHQVGLCEPPAFESAKGHHNPTGKEHGFEAANGPHAGDMANIYVVNGRARFQQFNPMVRFRTGDAPLADKDGTSLMVHAKMDDYRTQPSGDAGARMACGVVFGG